MTAAARRAQHLHAPARASPVSTPSWSPAFSRTNPGKTLFDVKRHSIDRCRWQCPHCARPWTTTPHALHRNPQGGCRACGIERSAGSGAGHDRSGPRRTIGGRPRTELSEHQRAPLPRLRDTGPKTLNEPARGTDVLRMTIASDDFPLAAPARHSAPAITEMPALLRTREALLERLAAELPSAGEQPASLLVIGLLRRDDGWPTTATTLAQVTGLVARSVRGDDWLGACGAAEFGLVLAGPASAAAVAAQRLVAGILALRIPGLAAAAGIAPLEPGLPAAEVFRRATLSLTAARRVGAGTVITYREPV
jgi:GGDEF domain-containing protein